MKKRMISLVLAAALAITMTACGSGSPKETTAATTEAAQLEGSLTDIVDEIYENAVGFEIAVAPAEKLDTSDAEMFQYITGMSGTDSVEEAVYSDAMINAVAYSMVLIRVKDGADVEKIKKEVLEGVDPRKWICVAAEKVVVTNCGNVIMMVMSDKEMTGIIYDAFQKVSGGKTGEQLTRVTEE